MLKILYIALGGALGSLSRYWLSGLIHFYFSSSFPRGTLIVNLTGSLIIGLLWGISDIVIINPNIKLFFFVGILGSFTTFSTFTLENFNLLRENEYGLVLLNVLLSLILGITLVFAGFFISRQMINLTR